MAEARIDVPEIYKQPYTPEESLYRLALGVGNSRISEALTLFQKEGMKGPEAMRQLFSLFEALPTSEDEDSGLYQTKGGVQPRHSWDQLEWAFTHPKELAPAQRESLLLLPRFALDSLAHEQMVIRAKGKKRTLSPVVKGTAEEVFQAYDQYVANVFDPELPELHVRGKAMMSFVAIATALAACGPTVTPKPTEQSATIPAITETYTPTETQTPTVTLIPTETTTPTKTEIPVPEYTKGPATSVEAAIRIKKEGKPAMKKDIMAHPALNGTDVDLFGKNRIQRVTTTGMDGVEIQCRYGQDCIIRATFTEANPFGGPDLIGFIWEFLEKDGSHTYLEEDFVPYVLTDDSMIFTRGWNQHLTKLQTAQDKLIVITLIAHLGSPENTYIPYAWSITNLPPPGSQTQNILGEVLGSADTDIIPDDAINIPLLGSGIRIYSK
jgi:hypothetical protein